MDNTAQNLEISPTTWKEVLAGEREKEYFLQILGFLERERVSGKTIYPPASQIFSALTLTPFEKVSVVILGQDPYHGPKQAHGLCFSVQPGVPPPPSLLNIFREISNDLGIPAPPHGNLEKWARQGVLLLNASLSVEAGKPLSHSSVGWETFTDKIISELSARKQNLVFLLWGAFAQKKTALIDASRHHILTAPHPSPLSASRGFFGCKHFSKTNAILRQQGLPEIDWRL
jgi:uracil-DNA glycosylase